MVCSKKKTKGKKKDEENEPEKQALDGGRPAVCGNPCTVFAGGFH